MSNFAAKSAIALYRPFCSSRCADVDLNRWLTGVYSIENADDRQGDDSVSETDEEA